MVLDSLSLEPIPFTNIWLEDRLAGATSNLNGEFEFKEINQNEHAVLTAVGYVSKRYDLSKSGSRLLLNRRIELLDEVLLRSNPKNTISIRLGKFKKS